MRAIVMTFDKNRPFTEHMIARYAELWPDHPFVFRVPYQTLRGAPSSRIEYIQTPSEISPTVLELLKNLPDNEWVFWAIDDKYPIHLNLNIVKRISHWVPTIEDTSISGVLFCRVREMLKKDHLTGATLQDDQGLTYLERATYQQIWIHQFLRVKVLRHLFESMPVDPINSQGAAVMDRLKKEVTRPKDQRLFVTRENFAAFGESTSRGKITENCYQSFLSSGLQLPATPGQLSRAITMGEETFTRNPTNRGLLKIKSGVSW